MLLEAVLLLVLWRRAVWRVLPLFCVSIAWNLAGDLAYCAFMGGASTHFVTCYVVQSVGGAILEFLYLTELVWSVLRRQLPDSSRSGVLWLGLLVGLTGIALAPIGRSLTIVSEPTNINDLIILQATMNLLAVACVVVIACCTWRVSMPWNDLRLCVAAGLGVLCPLNLGTMIFRFHAVAPYTVHWIDQIESAGYISVLAFWAIVLSKSNGTAASVAMR
jgi:hypothetical protein